MWKLLSIAGLLSLVACASVEPAEAAPGFSVRDGTSIEGNSFQPIADKLSAATSYSKITFTVGGGTCAHSRYVRPAAFTVTVGNTQRVVYGPMVSGVDDQVVNGSCTVNVTITAVRNARIDRAVGVWTITDDDAPPPVHTPVLCPDGTTLPPGGTCPTPPPPSLPPVMCPDGTMLPAGSACPPPVTPPPAPTIEPCKDGSTRVNCEPADVADNFPTSNAIQPTNFGFANPGALPPESGDSVGAFRIVCPGGGPGVPAKLGQFDPMVFPGQAKAGHIHTFGVNDGINPNSNYTSLRTSGSGCGAPSSIAVYRSAFWFPSMLDGAGNAVMPDYFNTYYKQLPATHPDCKVRAANGCTPLPNGLRFIEGWNASTGQGGPGGYYECWTDDQGQRVAGTGRASSIDALIAQGCGKVLADGKRPLLMFQTGGPECWNGTEIDSTDHRSHVAYPSRPVSGLISDGGNSNYGCPATHPFLIPQISIRLVFTTDANFEAGKWRWACDEMTVTKVSGSCGHFDYWEAWSPVVKATWQKYCIDGHKSCSGGTLGDGTEIKGLVRWPQQWVRHQLVPLSSIGM